MRRGSRLSPCFAQENRDFGSLLVATLILIQFLTTVKLLVWSFFALLLPRGSPLGYEQVVRFTFDFLCIYELQFFGAPCLVEGRSTLHRQRYHV